MDSSRFPGKVLNEIGFNQKVLDFPIKALKSIDEITIIIATSDRPVDDPIKEYAISEGVNYFLGSLEDVALRTIGCCHEFNLDYFFRINGDSPFVNSGLLMKAIDLLKTGQYDIISNLIQRTYPYGVACELINAQTFEKYYPSFSLSELEHITSFFYKNLKEINFAELPLLGSDLSQIKLTIDTPEDFYIINSFFKTNNLRDIHLYDIEKMVELYIDFIKQFND